MMELPDAGGNTNVEKMYAATRLSLQIKHMLEAWDEKKLTVAEFEFNVSRWFIKNDTRENFLRIIDRARARRYDILYGPAASAFRLQLKIQLWNDVNLRFRELHEALSMLAFLTAEEPSVKRSHRRTSLDDAFK